jgi:RNA polymerase sigma-70 factor (ECF subfamily)
LYLWLYGHACSARSNVPQSTLDRKYEADLIARAIQNDAAAVRALMRQCNRRLYRIARSVMRDDSEAEDVLQAAYGLAFTSLRRFRGESGICTWLARIVLNEALARLRRQDTVDHVSMQDPQGAKSLSLVDKQPDPERIVAQREIQRLLERAIDNLPQEFRMVLVMRTIEGMSVEETAKLLGIRSETVKTRLHRARAILRAKFEMNIVPLLTDTFPFDGERCVRFTARVLSRLKLPDRSEARSLLPAS